MADQSERIVLEFPVDQAVKNAGRINSEIGQVEKTSERAAKSLSTNAQQTGQSIVTIMDRSRASTERLVASIEARVFGLKPKLDQLAAQRDQALNRVGGDSNASARINSAFDKLIAKQKEVESGAHGLGETIKGWIEHPLSSAGNAAESFVAQFGKVGVVAAGVGVGLVAAGVAAFELVESQTAAAKATVNLSEELGVSISQTAVLQAQARIAGVGVDSFAGLVRKLSHELTDNSEASQGTRKKFQELGIDLVDIKGNLRDPISLLGDFSDRLSKFPDHAHKVALLNDAFGKGAVALLPLLEHFRETEEAANKLGAGLDADVTKRLAETEDELDKIGIAWGRLRLEMAGGIVATIKIIRGDFKFEDITPQGVLQQMASLSATALPVGGVNKEARARVEAEQASSADFQFGGAQDVVAPGVFAGRKLIEQFQNRPGLEAMKRKLADLERQQAEANPASLTGADASIVQQRINRFDDLGGKIVTQKAQIKEMEEAPQRIAKAVQDAAAGLNAGIEAELGPISKILYKFQQQIDDAEAALRKEPTGSGRLQLFGAISDLQEGRDLQVTAESNKIILGEMDLGRKAHAEEYRAATEDINRQAELSAKVFQDEKRQAEEVANIRGENLRDELGLSEISIKARRDSELRSVESLAATTVGQKIAVEQKKAEIEEQYAQKSLELKTRMLDLEQSIELAKAGDNAELILAIDQKYGIAQKQLQLATDAEITAAQQTAQVNSTRIVVDENQKRLDTLQRQAEGVFDSMVRAWKDGWSGAASFFETLLLTAIKNVVTSQIARSLNQMMGGFDPGQRAGKLGGGFLGSLLGAFGGGGGSFAIANPAAALGPGNTSGFAGPLDPFKIGSGGPASHAGIPDVGGIASIAKGGFSASSLAGLGLGVAGLGLGGAFKLGQSDSVFGKAAAIPTGVASGLLGFGALTSLFPALIGAGPVGWIAAAGIGAVAGLLGIFRKKAEDKIVEKVKSVYGINIDKSFAKDPLVGIIKQNFGGDIDVGIRSPQVRELLELYAMSTGQNPGGLVAHVRSSTFANVGGVLQQLPTYQNGEAVFAGARVSTALNPGGSSGPVVIQSLQVMVGDKSLGNLVDGRAAEVVRSSGRAVAQAAAQGQKDGVARRSASAFLLQPGFRTS